MQKFLFLLAAAGALAVPLKAQIVYTNPAVEQSDAYLSGNPCQRDLLLFVELLRTSHPAFCTGQKPPFAPDSVAEAGYRRAARCRSAEELQPLLQQIAAGLHDGHTQVQAPSKTRSHYPLQVFQDGEELRLQSVAREYASQLGKRIDSMNGHPAQEVLDSFRTAVCCDNDAGFRRAANTILQSPQLWQQSPYGRKDSVLRITFADGERIELSPRSGKPRNLQPIRTEVVSYPVRRTREAFAYTLLPERSVCYLQFNRCQDRSAMRMIYRYTGMEITEKIEEKLQSMPRFDDFLEEMFRRIETDSIRTLVIDLSRNGGGNSRLCDVLLSWLRPRGSLETFTSLIRLSPLWERQYLKLARKMRERFARSGQTIDPDRLYDLRDTLLSGKRESGGEPDRLFRVNKEPERCFSGRVVVVQGPQTYSSAGILATMIADNGIGEVIGVEGSFSPSHWGDLLLWELPNTGLSGTVSSKRFRRPDTSRDAEPSLRPDAVLTQTWEEFRRGIDPVLEWLLDRTAPEELPESAPTSPE